MTLNGQERVMGDVSATTSAVGTNYISWYFTVDQRLYVKMVILRGTEGVVRFGGTMSAWLPFSKCRYQPKTVISPNFAKFSSLLDMVSHPLLQFTS